MKIPMTMMWRMKKTSMMTMVMQKTVGEDYVDDDDADENDDNDYDDDDDDDEDDDDTHRVGDVDQEAGYACLHPCMHVYKYAFV